MPAARELQQESDHDDGDNDHDGDLNEAAGGFGQRELLEQPPKQYNDDDENREVD